jgi:REP element-mobilizing transposase RayT
MASEEIGMGRPLRIEYPGAFYHVTSRGNEQKDVFKSQKDREKFLSYLESATERYGAAVHVYCLMSNHYHLLMETPEGNLSQVMRHINGAYTNYFNTKRKRAGHLFQGRYKAILVEKDAYALELSRYIHLNPVRAGMVKMPEEYRWSSYRSYIGMTGQPDWLRTKEQLGQFHGGEREKRGNYRRFVEDAVGEDGESPLVGVLGSTILGSHEFIAEIEEKHLEAKQADRDIPDLRRIACRWSVEEIIETVRGVLGKESILAKKLSIYLCHRYSGARLKEIGDRFGIGAAGVSQESRRFAIKMDQDGELRKIVNDLREKMKCVNV